MSRNYRNQRQETWASSSTHAPIISITVGKLYIVLRVLTEIRMSEALLRCCLWQLNGVTCLLALNTWHALFSVILTYSVKRKCYKYCLRCILCHIMEGDGQCVKKIRKTHCSSRSEAMASIQQWSKKLSGVGKRGGCLNTGVIYPAGITWMFI